MPSEIVENTFESKSAFLGFVSANSAALTVLLTALTLVGGWVLTSFWNKEAREQELRMRAITYLLEAESTDLIERRAELIRRLTGIGFETSALRASEKLASSTPAKLETLKLLAEHPENAEWILRAYEAMFLSGPEGWPTRLLNSLRAGSPPGANSSGGETAGKTR